MASIVYLGICTVASAQIATVQPGDWSDPGTWDCACVPDFNSGTISIGHAVTVSNDVTIDETTITTGGSLTINTGVTLFLNEDFAVSPLVIESGRTLTVNGSLDASSLIISPVQVDGNIINSGTITSPDPSVFLVNASATYTHSHSTGGDIPLATWDPASTVLVNNMSAASPLPPNNLNQVFGNFTWNCPAMGNNTAFSLGGQLTNVQGSLTFAAANNRSIRFNSGGAGYTLTIGQDFVLQNGSIILSQSATSGLTTVIVSRDYNQTGGNMTFRASNNFDVRLEVGRHFTKSVGAFAGGSGTGSVATLSFNGGTSQNVSIAGTNPASINYEIVNGSQVNLGTSFLTGAGSFTLATGSTLGVGATDAGGAIQTGASAGNIRVTGARTYNAGSTILYNGSAAQVIGNGHPSGALTTRISNASGVSLFGTGNSYTFSDLVLTTGNLTIGNNTLVLSGSLSVGANALVASTSSSLTINGTGTLTGGLSLSGTTINNFTLNRTSSGLVALNNNLTVLGTFTQTAGDLNIDGRSFTISGDYVRSGGSIRSNNSSTLIIDGTGVLPASFSFGGSLALATFTLDRSGATVSTSSSLTITNLNLLDGVFDNLGTLTMATAGVITRTDLGSVTNTPVATSSYSVVYDISGNISTGPELPATATELASLTKLGSAVLTLGNDITVNGTLTLSNGSFNAGTRAIDIKGNFVSNATSTLTSSSFTFSGTTTLSGGTAPIFGNVTITGSLTPSATLNINGNLINNGTLVAGNAVFGGTTTISGTSTSSFNNVTINGTLNAPAAMNVAGIWTNNGTFNRGTSTNVVTFNGTSSIAGANPTIFSGVTISGTLNGPATLTLAGHFTNNGTFNAGTGTVVFAGNNIQNISGSVVTNFNHITITNTAGPPAVRVQSDQNLRGTLTLASNAQFDADGSSGTSVFTLISSADDPTADGMIATLPTGASISGNVTVQRYMAIEAGPNGNNRIYRYISSPVSNAPVSQLQATIPVTGSFTGSSTCSGCGSSQTMFAYDETVTTGDLNAGYIDFPAAANTETLAAGRGYAVFIRGNIAPITTAGSALWSVRSTVNTGTVNYPVSFTSSGNAANDGWNLVGNPYPATLDWDAASGWTRTNIDNAIYIPDNGGATATYATYVNGISANGGSRYIAMGQGFWVKANAASPVMSSTEATKAGGTQTSFFRQGAPSNLLRVTLRSGSQRDETVVYFQEGATEGFDGAFDAYKLNNSTLNLSTLADTVRMAINGLPLLGCGTTVQLNLSEVGAGGYSLNFSDFESFTDDVAIQLFDAVENRTIDVRKEVVYNFIVSTDPATFGKDRFQLRFTIAAPGSLDVSEPEAVCTGSAAAVSVLSTNVLQEYSLWRDGALIGEPMTGNGGTLLFTVDAALLQEGSQVWEVRSVLKTCSDIKLSKPVTLRVEGLPTVSGGEASRCGQGTVVLVAGGAPAGGFRWYTMEVGGEVLSGGSDGVLETPMLDKSVTFYVAGVNVLGCEGPRVPVQAQINYAPEVTGVTGGQVCAEGAVTLRATGGAAGNYRWYEEPQGGEPLAGFKDEEFITPVLTDSRTYYVAIVGEGGCEGQRVPVQAEVVTFEDAAIEFDTDRQVLVSNYESGNQWYFNGMLLPDANGPELSVTESGEYMVEVRPAAGCVTSASRTVVVTGLEPSVGVEVALFPNPVVDRLTVRVRSTEPVGVSLLGVRGERIGNLTLRSEGAYQVGQFIIAGYPAGIYLVQVAGAAGIQVFKIVKQ